MIFSAWDSVFLVDYTSSFARTWICPRPARWAQCTGIRRNRDGLSHHRHLKILLGSFLGLVPHVAYRCVLQFFVKRCAKIRHRDKISCSFSTGGTQTARKKTKQIRSVRTPEPYDVMVSCCHYLLTVQGRYRMSNVLSVAISGCQHLSLRFGAVILSVTVLSILPSPEVPGQEERYKYSNDIL